MGANVSRDTTRTRCRVHAAGVVLAAGAVVTTAVAVAPAVASMQSGATVSDVKMVQANLMQGMPVPQFQADVKTILSQHPDFITYNEVSFRHDAVLAPAGYGIYRSMRNRYTSETPVVWRSDRWKAIDEGTFRISNWRGIPPGKKTQLGRRFANWVTLKGTDGRVVSVVSVHVAPLTRGMPDLLRHSVERLTVLVGRLAPRGPVLVGGDFNVHYRGHRYPRRLLSAAQLVPTYDTLGAYFPTGDHHGLTIDYIFDRGTTTLLANKQYHVELNSDHDAVVAGFDWQVDLASQSHVVRNNPDGDLARRRVVVRAVLDGIRSAKPGSVVNLATTRLVLPRVVRVLDRALNRGVRVHVVLSGTRVTRAERRLSRHIASSGDAHNWLRQCQTTCRRAYFAAGLTPGFLMVSNPSHVWRVRYDASRKLSYRLVRRSSWVRISTGEVALRTGAQLFRAVG